MNGVLTFFLCTKRYAGVVDRIVSIYSQYRPLFSLPFILCLEQFNP